MTIDFHVHGKVTKKFPFIKENFIKYIEKAESEEIDCIALTEHCHAIGFEKAYRYLEDNYRYFNNHYTINKVKVLVGMEVETSIGLDIILIGSKDEIFNLRNEINNRISIDEFIEIEELFKIGNFENMIVILAHPFRKHDQFPELPSSIINQIDAIECNASDLFNNGIEIMKEKVDALALKLNLPVVGGSDSHYFYQLGSIKNVFEEETECIQGIKNMIKEKKFKMEISRNLTTKVKFQKIIKEPF